MAGIQLLVVLVILGVLLAIRVPVAFSLLASGAVGIFLLRDVGFTLGTVASTAFSTPSRYVLIIIPLFIAMGIFAKHGTLAEDGFLLAHRMFRRIPGGTALATVVACAIFAAVSGSSVATAASLGPVTIREMKRRGYDVTFAAGIVGAAGTLGVLIPPSILLVMYGVVVGESIGLLLIAGIVPGVLSAALYMFAIIVRSLRNPALVGKPSRRWQSDVLAAAVQASGEDDDRSEPGADFGPGPEVVNEGADGVEDRDEVELPTDVVAAASRTALADRSAEDERLGVLRGSFTVGRVGLLFGIVIGGIYFGIMTATEAAAIGALLSFLFFFFEGLFRAPKHLWGSIQQSTVETVGLTTMTFALLVGAAVFTTFLVLARVPDGVTNWAVGLPIPGTLLVIFFLLMFIPLGLFLDSLSMLLIAVPITYPVVTALGFDGIWYGILAVKMMEIGLVTPPFGLNAYVIAGASDGEVSVPQAFSGVLKFVPIDLLTTAILFAFPWLVLGLPYAGAAR